MVKAKVLVTARSFGKISSTPQSILEEAGFEVFSHPRRGPLNKEEMIPLISEADAIIVGTDVLDKEVLSHGKKLKVISKHGVGVDNVDLAAADDQGVVVTNTPGANTNAVAELALGMMLGVSRNIVKGDHKVRDGQWGSLVGQELSGKQVGIVGFGAIGQRLTELLQGFKCKIVAYDPYAKQSSASELGVTLTTLEQLLATSDYVSVHVPNTPDTNKMFAEEAFSKMKQGAFLINLARGGVVDETALANALQEQQIAGAACDVFSEEPPSLEHPLFAVDNLIVTPHMGAHSREGMDAMSVCAARNVVEVLNGLDCANIVSQS